MEKSTSIIDYSVVIPIYNEQDNIAPLLCELEETMKSLTSSWELIFVDDGSTDRSGIVIEELAASRPFLKYLRFKKNTGQSAALDAGFKAACGAVVITLDGDGQNDPKDIPALVAALYTGYDLIAGKRVGRKDTWYKRLISKMANYARKCVLDDTASDTGCSLKIYRRDALRQIRLYKGMHRFLPALFVIHGFTVKEMAVTHRPRLRGSSKYGLFNRGFSLVCDLMAVAWMKKRQLSYQIEQK